MPDKFPQLWREKMKLKRSAAVSLLVALGAAMAGKWTAAKLLGKLKKIDELVDDDTKLEGEDAATLKAIQKANEAEGDIEIEDDVNDEDTEAQPVKGKKAKKDPEAKKGKRPTTNAKPNAPRDQFGNREGSQAAAINAVMTKKSQTAKEIAEASGFEAGRVKGHLAFLVGHGYAEKTEKGYKLTGKTKGSSDSDEKPAKAEKPTKAGKPEKAPKDEKPTKKVKAKKAPKEEEEEGDDE